MTRDPELECPSWFEHFLVDDVAAEYGADFSDCDTFCLWEDFCDWARGEEEPNEWAWFAQLDWEANNIKKAA